MYPVAGAVYISEVDPTIRLVINQASKQEADGSYFLHVGFADDGSAPSVELCHAEWEHFVDNLQIKICELNRESK